MIIKQKQKPITKPKKEKKQKRLRQHYRNLWEDEQIKKRNYGNNRNKNVTETEKEREEKENKRWKIIITREKIVEWFK